MKKTISELSPELQEEQRQKWRDAQNKTREKKKAGQIPSYDEAVEDFPEAHTKLLSDHVKYISVRVKSELGVERFGDYQNNEAAESAIFEVAWTLFAFKRDWVQQVHSPSGELVGGTFYPDSLGAGIVKAAHRYGLLNSATFVGLFGELLQILDKRYGHEETKHSRAVKQELGEFTARQCTPLSSTRLHSDAPRS